MDPLTTSQALHENYDRYYDQDISQWREIGAVAKAGNVLALCRDIPHARIVDIGCGDGAILRRLAEADFGRELYALEISSSALEAVERQQIDRLVEARRFDGYTVPYEDGWFDLAILSHVVEHVEYPRRLLYEAARVARHVFVEVPLEDKVTMRRDFVPDRVGHINFYSPRTIRRLVQTCGLTVLGQEVTNPPRAAYEYQSGRKGTVKYGIKAGALRVAPRVATLLFSYHCALLCASPRAGT